MNTRIYIDGVNLYYGSLKSTPYKWLDLVKLFAVQLPQERTTCSNVKVKYFTATINEKATTKPETVTFQRTYLNALEALYPDTVFEVIHGYFDVKPSQAYLIDSTNPKVKPRACKKVDVWKFEEKQSDVNIAIHALKDAFKYDDLEQIIFVTNDSDLSPVLETLKTERPNIQLGLVTPTRGNHRFANKKLIKFAD